MSSTSPTSGRKVGQEKNKKANNHRLYKKACSFHGRDPEDMVGKLVRPRTLPDLLPTTTARPNEAMSSRPRLTKLLLNVTIQRSSGAVHVLLSPEATVWDLISAALRQYEKEGRRSSLPSLNPAEFDLHYSQFSLESLDEEEKVMDLGSRNFFVCQKRPNRNHDNGCDGVTITSTSSCSKQAKNGIKFGLPFFKLINFQPN